MPELPEVENARQVLIKFGLPGRAFAKVQVGWANNIKGSSVEDFVLALPGRRIAEINRRGKYLLLSIDADETLIIHLGMTGGLKVQPASEPADQMVRHTFGLDDGRELRFRDPRKFGHLRLTADLEQDLPAFGPEPLSPAFTPEILAANLQSHSAPLKAMLLEQSIVAGLGNLYVDESLYLSGLNPLRPANSLNESEIVNLHRSIVTALQSATDQYTQARETEWPDPPSALHTWTIPRKDGAPCPQCQNPISAIRIRGRGTFFCPLCQGETPR